MSLNLKGSQEGKWGRARGDTTDALVRSVRTVGQMPPWRGLGQACPAFSVPFAAGLCHEGRRLLCVVAPFVGVGAGTSFPASVEPPLVLVYRCCCNK